MKKKIFSLLFSCFAFGALPVSGQQSVLLEKYRTMALDYNHDLKAACFPVLPVFRERAVLPVA